MNFEKVKLFGIISNIDTFHYEITSITVKRNNINYVENSVTSKMLRV